jgi:tetratricopeptide (TPR) repeat protein
MSRFRPLDRGTPREDVGTPQNVSKLVPIPPEEFARQRRQKFLKWGSGAALVALLIGSFLYRSSIPAKALNHYIDAKKFYDTGKYTDALEAVNEAIRDRGERARAYQLRAEIFRAMHQPKDAAQDITRLIEMQPNAPEHYDFRAQTYLEIDDAASAVRDYTKLIELSNSGEAYNGRGLCYVKLNENQKAIDDFTKSIERSPQVESFFQRGLAWGALGEHRKAIADFDHAIEMRPDLSAAYRARAAEKQKTGDATGAERDRQKAAGLEKPVLPKPAQVALPKRA